MLTPERGEHPQLGEGGRPPEQRGDALVFSVGEVVLANQVGRDRGVAPERCGGGGSLGHASDAFAPETPRSRARNTRAMMFGSGCASTLSASPASYHIPLQCVH